MLGEGTQSSGGRIVADWPSTSGHPVPRQGAMLDIRRRVLEVGGAHPA